MNKSKKTPEERKLHKAAVRLAYYHAHKEQATAARRKHYEANKEEIKKKARERYLANVKYEGEKRITRYQGRRQSELAVQRKYKYGMDEATFQSMLEKQGGLCAICLRPEERVSRQGILHNLSVDHCHETGIIRGLLCNRCNRGIGWLGDSAATAQKAADYLRIHEVRPGETDLHEGATG